ncbi:glycoside hydrolase family 6 protein [Actinoplanes subtropicus]|uniref:glycoside hydrolase family 6 protein n=1 Tax=Actinoplanes subtropicus TaxID=543632 RepID=UPI0004C30570|nr:glycoside hydrolase family 6 protein [Actinoplanes subtropicus]
MSPLPVSPRARRLTTAVAAGLATAAGVWFAAGAAHAGTVSGVLYRDPDTAVARWVAANPNDSRTAVIRDKIASQPASHWLSNFNVGTVQADVSGYVNGANAAGQIPVLTVYGITNRDCGGASAGGAPDLNQYQTWIGNIARGLGGQTVLVMLEPDSLALQTCLSASDVAARDQALHTATRTLKAANPNAKVYLDAGHSAWNSATDQAGRLVAAGVADADGFYSNVSNFNPTNSEAAYGRSILAALSGQGVTGKHQVIDTSRNGGASGDWCGDDNTDRRIGLYPTTATGDANIDAYLWVKPPGEADGCKYAAGSFQPDLAYSLASSAPNPPTTPPTTRPTTAPTTAPTTTPTTTPTTAPTTGSTGGCSATYQTTSSWQGGFQAQVTVKAGGSAIAGWTVTWPLGSGQSITQLWNGELVSTSPTATVRNLSWNGALAANGTAQFGFLANGTASTPTVTCTSR